MRAIEIIARSGTPESAIAAPPGWICVRTDNGTVYIKNSGTGTTGWLALVVNGLAPVRLKGYTVATLPAGTVGDTAYVTDALLPAYLAAVAGGGAVKTPVFYDGTNWVAV